MNPDFEEWIGRQYRIAATEMLASFSATGLVKKRLRFGQIIRPRTGSILASPEPGDYDPDPDYFFHWPRDAAAVIEALRHLWRDDVLPESEVAERLADYVRFELACAQLDGRALVRGNSWREKIAADGEVFVRSDEELADVHGAQARAEARVNPDATLDILHWARPQHDGPALRALALLRWSSCERAPLEAAVAAGLEQLVSTDLNFVLSAWSRPCFDIWEEELGHHFYTLLIQAAALSEGARWLADRGEAITARACAQAEAGILERLEDFWVEEERFYRSRMTDPQTRAKELDMSVVLGAVHAGESAARHSVRDERMAATLARLAQFFKDELAINRDAVAPLLGRYAGDIYFGGGAWYLTTLAAAEFEYASALAQARSHANPSERLALGLARGDAFLGAVRAYVPADGRMSEQVDRDTGAQISAKRLAWSYAALISCVHARKCVRGAAPERGKDE